MSDKARLSAVLDKYDRLFIAFALLLAIALHLAATYVTALSWLSPLTSNWLSTASLVAVSTLVLRRALSERREFDADLLASRLADAYASRILQTERVARCVADFQERLKDFSWTPYLSKASALEVVVAFHGHWIQENEEALIGILERHGTIAFYLPDPNDLRILEDTAIRFGSVGPAVDPLVVEQVKAKILDTRRALLDLYTTAGCAAARLRVCYCPVTISYSATRIDNEFLVLSIFEHFGAARTGPPAIVLDLRRSAHLRHEFEKEFAQLANVAATHGRIEEFGPSASDSPPSEAWRVQATA